MSLLLRLLLLFLKLELQMAQKSDSAAIDIGETQKTGALVAKQIFLNQAGIEHLQHIGIVLGISDAFIPMTLGRR